MRAKYHPRYALNKRTQGGSPVQKTFLSLSVAVALGMAPLSSSAQEFTKPGELYNYIAAYQLADRIVQELGSRGVEISKAALQAGIDDRLAKKEPRFSQEQIVAAIQTIQDAQKTHKDAATSTNVEAGKTFLAENATKEGVTVLESGLQYTVATPGTGAIAQPSSTVVVHYRGTLLDGTEFDSSYARGEPARFSPGGVIPGFREALLAMKEGAKWRVFIPSELAYGEQGAGDKIGPHQTLIFDLELIEIVKEQ
jgi:FKBP-type peptidyl-prolyl cis-trans isomerase FklB